MINTTMKRILILLSALCLIACDVKEIPLETLPTQASDTYELKRILLEETSTNSYLLSDKNRKCIIIDPAFRPKSIAKTIKNNNYTPMAILLTHNHWDHSKEINRLSELLNVPIITNQNQIEMGKSDLGIEITAKPIQLVSHQDMITIGDLKIEILYSPGHSTGSMCFYHKASGSLFSGDTLFKGSIGRVDFDGSEPDKIIHSIFSVLNAVDSKTAVYPGHGDSSIKEYELEFNPFLRQ